MSLYSEQNHATASRVAPVRVVHIIEATEGGTRRWIENVLLGLDPARVRQACICSTRRDESFLNSIERFRERGIPVWTVDMRRGIHLWSDLQAMQRIRQILVGYCADVIHAHSSTAGFVGRVAARLAGKGPIVYSPHAFAFLAGGACAPVYYLAEKVLRPLTDVLLAVSESEAEFSRQVGFPHSKVRVIANGVNVSELGPIQSNPMHGCQTIGTVTSFRPQKDAKTFLKACRLLHRDRSDIRFVACGGGPQLAAAKRLAERLDINDCVEFTGRVSDVFIRLPSWSLFVLATHYEGLSYALLEAMAAARPVVASRVPGVEEVIADGRNGLLVPPGNPEALAEAMKTILEQPSLAERLGAAARDTVSERYALDNQLCRLTSLYSTLREGSNRRGHTEVCF